MKYNHIDKVIEKEEAELNAMEQTMDHVTLQEKYLRAKAAIDKKFEENLGKAQQQKEGLKGIIKDKQTFLKFLYDEKNENQNTA